jgi:hypothetical protein
MGWIETGHKYNGAVESRQPVLDQRGGGLNELVAPICRWRWAQGLPSELLDSRIVIPLRENRPVTQTITERLHIVEGSDWKDAVIALLEPKSPYRPWRHGFGEAHAGDPVAVVLNTDPASVLTGLAYIGSEGDPGCAVIDMPRSAGLVDLTTLALVLDLEHCAVTTWRLDGDAAMRMELALAECQYRGGPELRFGHTSTAAARILLRSGGTCDGCDNDIDLSGTDARNQVYIHTVDPYRRPDPTSPIVPRAGGSHHPPSIPYTPSLRFRAIDWPAVLCRRCHESMRDGGYRRFLDFRFDQHPVCPECGGRRSLSTFYGMPSDHGGNIPPWLHTGGCCVSDERWCCSVCDHEW